MALVEWDAGLDVGVQTFNEQHKKLVGLLNKLHAAMKEGKGSEVLGTVLDELISYTDYHFSSEEHAFESYDYPQCAAHVAEHKKLLETARDLQEKQRAGTLLLSVEVMDFLTKWVTEHIKKCDRLYTSFFADKPV